MRGYFHRHDLSDAMLRLQKGTVVRLGQLFHPEGKWRLSVERKGKAKRIVLPHRGLYLVGLGALVLAMAAFAASQARLRSAGPVTLPVLLGLATFAAYVMATGWYLPTASRVGLAFRKPPLSGRPSRDRHSTGLKGLRPAAGHPVRESFLRILKAARFSPVAWTALLCGLGAAGIAIFLLSADKPWSVELQPGRPLRIHQFVVIYGWWAAAINLALLVLLGVSARWWLRPARQSLSPWLPEQRTPRWFWPLVIAAMVLTAFWGIQRIPQSLWDDEDSSLHRAVLGQYRRDKSGGLKLKETTWETALWNYWKPANHQLQTVFSKACLQAWRTITRPVGLQFSEPAVRFTYLVAGV
jgi:hypothetical protein